MKARGGLLSSFSSDHPYALFEDGQGGLILFSGCVGEAFLQGEESSSSHQNFLVRLSQYCDALSAASERGEWVVVNAEYELGFFLEPKLFRAMVVKWLNNRTESPILIRAWFFSQREFIHASERSRFFQLCTDENDAAGFANIGDLKSFSEYQQAIERIQKWITDGDCYQINYTFPMQLDVYGHPLDLYNRLYQRQFPRYGCVISVGDTLVVSLSPELFFTKKGNCICARPMKGTAERFQNSDADARSRDRLKESTKEMAENVMIVDLLRNDLGRLATIGGVSIPSLFEIEAYPTVWQMVSSIEATVPSTSSWLDVFFALFPCGSVTGAPKIRAMELINEVELAPRKTYTGALGWVSPDGDCSFNVAIRTLEIEARLQSDGVRHARLGIGSGVVSGASPMNEYRECLLKANFVRGMDPGFLLIETMRFQGGIQFLPYHLQRLQASALVLGFQCDVEDVRAKVLKATAVFAPECLVKVRVTMSFSGEVLVRAELIDELPSGLCACFWPTRLEVPRFLSRHKTSVRSLYDSVLQRLVPQEAMFDAIFLSQDGFVVEGARSNVFLDLGGGALVTPPVSDGALPGVLRAALIDSGQAVERRLSALDVIDARQVFLGNALRGLVAVNMAPVVEA